jgi:small subunit ribosomal protein S1
VGDEVDVLLERLENDEGMVVLSKEKAAYRQNWNKIVHVFQGDGLIKGKVKSIVKGGLMVNIGVEAFLPASQIDVVPPKDLQQFVGNTYDFKIVKLNDDRKNVVLSRREVIEQERSEKRQKFMEGVNVGDRVTGTVKNLTDFGAFIDLDGMDGLLHITDMNLAVRARHVHSARTRSATHDTVSTTNQRWSREQYKSATRYRFADSARTTTP